MDAGCCSCPGVDVIAAIASIWWRALRASNLPTVWTNVLMGTLLALPQGTHTPQWWPLLLLIAGGSCAYLAGMAHNDLCDEPFDRSHKTPRPLVTGALTRRSMQIMMCGLLVGFIATVTAAAMLQDRFDLVTKALLIGLFLSIVAYNVLHRLHGGVAGVLMAACRALLVLLAAQIAGGLDAPQVWIGATAVACWTAGITLLARGERGGEPTVRGWLALFIIAAAALPAVGLTGSGPLPYATFGGLLIIGAGWIPTIWRTHANGRPVPAVIWSILGLCVLDSGLLLAADQLIAAGVAMACMALCMALQRRTIGT